MNPFMPGKPIDDSVRISITAVSRGITVLRPPNSLIWRVCRRSDSMPTMQNRPPVVTPCASIWYDAPCTPCMFMAAMPRTTKPMWLTEE